MNENMSIGSIKAKAKEVLLGNYRMASGAFVLMLIVVYAISSILLGAYNDNMSMLIGKDISLSQGTVDIKTLVIDTAVSNLVSIVVSVFSDLLLVGFLYIIVGISNKEMMKISDLFYSFRNHPDKVIIMSVIFSVFKMIVMLPSGLISGLNGDFEVFSLSPTSVSWWILIMLGNILYFIFFLNCGFCYLIYLRDSEKTALECVKESVCLMKGHKIRLFKMLFSLVGYYVLGILSFGIGFMYIYPFVEMALVYFYKDLAGDIKPYEDDNIIDQKDYWK